MIYRIIYTVFYIKSAVYINFLLVGSREYKSAFRRFSIISVFTFFLSLESGRYFMSDSAR